MQPSTPSAAMRIWNSSYTFWLLLSLPAIPMLISLAEGSLRGVLHPSGEFSARFMIIAMMLTPLVMLAPGSRALRWLMARRRALGVAAFFYGALHTLAYVMREGTLEKIIAELPQAGIWTGWVAFLLFIIPAVTSNEASLRRLGTWWKSVQRWVYPAALLTLAHWVFVSHGLGGIIVHFAPLAVLETYRIGRNLKWWSFRFGGGREMTAAAG
jgi:methionine sulfoxide reductase heme-binding subunit